MNEIVHFNQWVRKGVSFLSWVFNLTYNYDIMGVRFISCIVTMYNVRNIRISDGCVYTLIRKGLGRHLVTYTNRDMVPFLLLVQYKGGLSEIEFIVSLFSNACMILLLFFKILEILCTSHYIKGGIAILVRGHYKDTVARYDIETLFIIIESYVKLYIYLTVLEFCMTGLWRFVLLH